MKRWLTVLTIAALGTGCGLGDDNNGSATNNGTTVNNGQLPDPTETANNLKDKISTEVEDKLDCSGVVGEETRNLVTDAIAKANLDGDLVVSPTELARFVGGVALSTDTTAMMVGNVAQIARVGHLPQALGGQWDDFTCDDETTSACVDEISGEEKGSATTRVVCEEGAPTSVRATFDGGCQLFVTENSGALELRREDGRFSFDDFAIGSVRQVDGLLSVALDQGEVDRIDVAQGEGLSIASNAGKSCEERLTINQLVAEFAPAFTSVDIDAERLADEKTITLLTPDAPATWSKDAPCSCPDAGSAIEWGWKGFLMGQGDARVRLNYSEGNSDESCATVDVELTNWPEQCDGEGAAGDCGKKAVEELLGPIFTATCVGR